MLVLGVDPSMAHSGAVLISFGPQGRVIDTWDLGAPTSVRNYREYLEAFPAMVDKWMSVVTPGSMVVHEMPVSGKVVRPESSLLAGAALRYACAQRQVGIDGIDPRHVKKIVTGNPNITKPQIRAWFARNLPSWTTLSNEHRRDAALVALCWYLESQRITFDEWNSHDQLPSLIP